MRTATLVMILLVALAVAAGATTDRLVFEEKGSKVNGKPTYEGREVGDDITAPIIIPSLPFTEAGNSCEYSDDYDVECPYPGSTSPDVVYAFTADMDYVVDVDLCASTYDTKVYIFENVEGNVVCCNDDAGCGTTGYQSYMQNVFLYAGNTYYFVVDGYNGDCGDYVLDILLGTACDLQQPGDAFLEGEPLCGPGYDDQYNGGCNTEPDPVFQTIHPSSEMIKIFGTSGTYDDFSRDTDWYEIYLNAPNTITFSAIAEFPVLIFFLDGNLPLGCDDPDMVISSATGGPCELVALTETVGPGIYWLWVGPSVFSCQPCGLEYIAQICGYIGPSPVENVSWSTIKSLYR